MKVQKLTSSDIEAFDKSHKIEPGCLVRHHHALPVAGFGVVIAVCENNITVLWTKLKVFSTAENIHQMVSRLGRQIQADVDEEIVKSIVQHTKKRVTIQKKRTNKVRHR